MPRLLPVCLALLLIGLLAGPVQAQEAVPTEVMVRAVSHDAKLIGSNVGGARIVIQDVATGAVLAEGMQAGDTGDTERIMVTPHERGTTIYGTEGAAGFLATLDLTRPTPVDITAYGPMEPAHAMQRTTKRMLVVPGQHVRGEGVLLTLNGFSVRLLDVPHRAQAEAPMPVRVHVTMLCGCPTEPGGLWDADRITITAQLRDADGAVVAEAPLAFAGEVNTYEGSVPVPADGVYTLEVTAADAGRANFGMAGQTLVVE